MKKWKTIKTTKTYKEAHEHVVSLILSGQDVEELKIKKYGNGHKTVFRFEIKQLQK